MNVASWAADFTDLLLPAGCISCGLWVPGGAAAALVRARCRTRLKAAPWPRCERCHFPSGTGRTSDLACSGCGDWSASLSAARFAYVLAPPADDLVHALKYEGWPELAPLMASAMTSLRVPHDHQRAIVAPVPTTPQRLGTRGYNQAGLLADCYAADCSLALEQLLVRVGAGSSQTALHPSERRANVAGTFSVAAGAETVLTGAHVLLIDDVLTTGATACETADTLIRAGAERVTPDRIRAGASQRPAHGSVDGVFGSQIGVTF